MGHVVVLESFFFLISSFLRSFFQCLIGVRIAATCHLWAVIENPHSLNHTLLLLTPQHAGTVVLAHLLPLLLIATLPEWRVLICAISLGKNMYSKKLWVLLGQPLSQAFVWRDWVFLGAFLVCASWWLRIAGFSISQPVRYGRLENKHTNPGICSQSSNLLSPPFISSHYYLL